MGDSVDFQADYGPFRTSDILADCGSSTQAEMVMKVSVGNREGSMIMGRCSVNLTDGRKLHEQV